MTTLLLLGALTAPALAATPLVLIEAAYTDTSMDIALSSPDWRTRHNASVAQIWRDQPDLATDLWAVQPQLTRARFLRFWGGIVDEAGASVILLDRLEIGDEDASIRHALVDAIARSGTDFAQAFVEMMPAEPDPWVRAAYVNSLRKQDTTLALSMFRQALQDSDPYVRAEGARSCGWHTEGAQLASELIQALQDREAQVREAAARSLGVQRVDSAFAPVAELLTDDDAEVRLQALHAVERIDAIQAQELALPLLADNDARVARLAIRVSGN
jgi:HEAT repeat protein